MGRKILRVLLSLAIVTIIGSVVLDAASAAGDQPSSGRKITPIYPAGIVPIAPYSPGIMYGGLVELIVNAMVDIEKPFLEWEWH